MASATGLPSPLKHEFKEIRRPRVIIDNLKFIFVMI